MLSLNHCEDQSFTDLDTQLSKNDLLFAAQPLYLAYSFERTGRTTGLQPTLLRFAPQRA